MSVCKARELFDDAAAWRELETRVIAPLVAGRDPSEPVRVWSAVCGGGEDACCLAILLQESIERVNSGASFQIFATDDACDSPGASAAFYPARAMRGVSAERKSKWFDKEEQGFDKEDSVWRLKHSLRSRMVFSQRDPVTDPGFHNIDVAVSRHLAGVHVTEQAVVFAHLRAALRPGGALFLDAKAAPQSLGFEPVAAGAGLFRKTGEERLAPAAAGGRPPASVPGFDCKAEGLSQFERLQDTIEELQTSREELYALNRELTDVNLRLNEASKDREARIRQLEIQRNMLAGGEVVALFLDHDLRIQWFTSAAMELFPVSERDLGRPLTDFTPGFDDPAFFDALRKAMLTGRAQAGELRAASGRWYARTIRRYEQDATAAKGLAVTFADITAQKQSAEAARDYAERLQLALAVGELATWDWNLRSGVVAWSDEHFEMQGYAIGEIAPSYEAWAARVHPDDLAGAEAALRTARDGHASVDHDFRSLHPDGSIHWLSARGSFFYDEDGAPCRMIGVIRDITAQRRAREELLLLNSELERRVRQEVEAREKAMEQLAQAGKLAALGELAGGVAHDFNNTLQAIATSAEVMRRRPHDDETVRRAANLQIKATERGAAVTRRLLAFARRADLHSQPIAVAALLAGLRELLTAAFGPAFHIHVDAPDDLPLANADRTQIETVLVNLANNGRDAMECGGDLTLSARRDTVTQPRDGLLPGDYVRLAIADRGVGMDETTLLRAPEPFFTTKPVGRGTGLGLSMARGFAEQSGGALTVESELGRGTVVMLWLPVAAPPEPCRRERDLVVGDAPNRVSRVLLVDDETVIAELLSEVLREQGLDVTTTTSGAAAIAALESGASFDLLVSDLSMPDVSGLDVTRAARARRPGLPTIILTGYAGDAGALRLEQQLGGAVTFLRKPVAGEELLNAIKHLAPA